MSSFAKCQFQLCNYLPLTEKETHPQFFERCEFIFCCIPMCSFRMQGKLHLKCIAHVVQTYLFCLLLNWRADFPAIVSKSKIRVNFFQIANWSTETFQSHSFSHFESVSLAFVIRFTNNIESFHTCPRLFELVKTSLLSIKVIQV